jgi:hypothetical protein
MSEHEPRHEPHRPNYDELKKAHEAALEQKEALEVSGEQERKPTRPDSIRRPEVR